MKLTPFSIVITRETLDQLLCHADELPDGRFNFGCGVTIDLLKQCYHVANGEVRITFTSAHELGKFKHLMAIAMPSTVYHFAATNLPIEGNIMPKPTSITIPEHLLTNLLSTAINLQDHRFDLGHGVVIHKINQCFHYSSGHVRIDFPSVEELINFNKLLTRDEPTTGYHLVEIPKGVYGEVSKISEELAELTDAHQQQNKIMSLNEVSDLLGAIEGYLEKHHPGITLDDAIVMKNATKRAFQSGARK